MINEQDIENRFGFHKATIEGAEATKPKHEQLRMDYKSFANMLNDILPDGREKSIVLTKLEEASMWSHKSIAQSAPLEEAPVDGYISHFMKNTVVDMYKSTGLNMPTGLNIQTIANELGVELSVVKVILKKEGLIK